MRLTSLRCCSDILAGTLKRLNYLKCWRNVLPSTQQKLTNYSEQFKRHWSCWDIITTSQLSCQLDGPISDVFATSHWYVNKTDQCETSWQCTNWYLSETDQLSTPQRRFNSYLNETDIFEMLQQGTSWYPWSLFLISLISFRFIKNGNGSEHLN